MNGKQAKKIRALATDIVLQYAQDRVLTPEMVEGATRQQVINAVPDRHYYNTAGQVFLGKTSRRWILKQVKKNPALTYHEMLKLAGV